MCVCVRAGVLKCVCVFVMERYIIVSTIIHCLHTRLSVHHLDVVKASVTGQRTNATQPPDSSPLQPLLWSVKPLLWSVKPLL